jgi:hypothetical protein
MRQVELMSIDGMRCVNGGVPGHQLTMALVVV